MCFFGGAVGVEDFLEAFWLGREQEYPELFPALRWQLEGNRRLPYTPGELRFLPTLEPLRTFSTSTVQALSPQYGGASLGPRLWLVLPLCLLKTSETRVGTGMLLQHHFPQGELSPEDFSWSIECLNLCFTARSALLFHLWGTFMGVEQGTSILEQILNSPVVLLSFRLAFPRVREGLQSGSFALWNRHWLDYFVLVWGGLQLNFEELQTMRAWISPWTMRFASDVVFSGLPHCQRSVCGGFMRRMHIPLQWHPGLQIGYGQTSWTTSLTETRHFDGRA